MDGRIMRCGIISSCQSDASSEIVNRCLDTSLTRVGSTITIAGPSAFIAAVLLVLRWLMDTATERWRVCRVTMVSRTRFTSVCRWWLASPASRQSSTRNWTTTSEPRSRRAPRHCVRCSTVSRCDPIWSASFRLYWQLSWVESSSHLQPESVRSRWLLLITCSSVYPYLYDLSIHLPERAIFYVVSLLYAGYRSFSHLVIYWWLDTEWVTVRAGFCVVLNLSVN